MIGASFPKDSASEMKARNLIQYLSVFLPLIVITSNAIRKRALSVVISLNSPWIDLNFLWHPHIACQTNQMLLRLDQVLQWDGEGQKGDVIERLICSTRENKSIKMQFCSRVVIMVGNSRPDEMIACFI